MCTEAGDRPVVLTLAIPAPDRSASLSLTVGLTVCYDLRFPGLFAAYRAAGVDLVLVPAAFTVATGRAGHWEVLLRARAIEQQCFVVAAAQAGAS